MVILKGLKKIPKEVRDRKDCVVAVAKGGSMTVDLMQKFIREVWAKRPSATPFREPNILGMDIHYSHVDEGVIDTLKTVCNTTTKFTPGGCTGIIAGPDTHWNKPFKGNMRELMDEYMDTEEYELTSHGKMKPAPYSKICDWVVAAWNKIDPQTIINSFTHNGWDQCHNGNGLTAVHGILKDLLENNVVRGYQRRAKVEEIRDHNEAIAIARANLDVPLGTDVDSDEEYDSIIDAPDDFDFYRLEQEAAFAAAEENRPPRPISLPTDLVNFSDYSGSDTDDGVRDSGESEGESSSEGGPDHHNEDAASEASGSELEFLN